MRKLFLYVLGFAMLIKRYIVTMCFRFRAVLFLKSETTMKTEL